MSASSEAARCVAAGGPAIFQSTGGRTACSGFLCGDGGGSSQGSPCIGGENLAAQLSAKRPCDSDWRGENSKWSQT